MSGRLLRPLRRPLLAAALATAGLLSPIEAQADPVTIGFVLGGTIEILGFEIAVTTLLGAAATVGGSVRARNKAKRMAAAARAAYNANLSDRTITALQADPELRTIYGRAHTGGDVVAMFTTDKPNKPDAYKHLVVVWSGRQCQAIHDLEIDGVSLGGLDAEGWALGSEWRTADNRPLGRSAVAGNIASALLAAEAEVVSVTLVQSGESPQMAPVPAGGAQGWSFSGSTVSLPGTIDFNGADYAPQATDTWEINYTAPDATAPSTVRVRHHLGTADQAADAVLMALVPGQWTINHRLRGRCYSVITLDLERQQFQGGPPGIVADISGALVYDPRTGTTAWSDNPALCSDDWLRSDVGHGVTSAEVDQASVIAAANACDVSTSFTVGGVTTTGPRYTCNGVFLSGAPREVVRQDLEECMAGSITYGGNWRVNAGTWSPPVMDLGDDDLYGSIEIVQAGEPSGELFNAVRGQFVPAASAVPADLEVFRNEAFITADGKPLWRDLDLPFTNGKARGKNLSRIAVERSRNGLVIFFPAKMRAWPLQVGDRVRVSSVEFGFVLKTFIVTDWGFGLRSPVGLTLQEDSADAYDDADAATADPTPNTGLPDPWVVPELASLGAASGTAQLLRRGDGGIESRVLVSWPRSSAAYMQGGRIELSWRESGSDVWNLVNADGDEEAAWLRGVRDGSVVLIGATVVNSMGARSSTRWRSHLVLGKLEAPAAVAGFALNVVPGALKGTRTPSTELDYARTIYRYGASFASGTAVPGTSDGRGFVWPWPPLGPVVVWAADVDTSGNVGPAVSQYVNVDASLLIDAGSIDAPAEWLNSNIAVGGRNLLVGASSGAGWTYDYHAGNEFRVTRSSTGETGYIYSSYITLPGSTQVTLSFEAKQDGPVAGTPDWFLLPDNYVAIGLSSLPYTASTDWTKRTFTFITPTGWGAGASVRLRIDHNGSPDGAARTYFARRIKLELGNKNTDWTPPIEDVAADAQAKSDAAQAAAEAYALAKANLAEVTAKAYADGIVSDEEGRAIADATAKANAAQAAAISAAAADATTKASAAQAAAQAYALAQAVAADTAARAYADGIVSDEEARAIADATSKANAARAAAEAAAAADATAKANVAALTAQWSGVSGAGKPLDNAGIVVDLGGGSGPGQRFVDDPPSFYVTPGKYLQFKRSADLGLSGAETWATLETTKQYPTDEGGGKTTQYVYSGTGTWRRTATSDASSATWTAWVIDLDRNNYSGALDATRNLVFRQGTDPGGAAIDGDVWQNTSTGRSFQKVGGAWQPYVGAGSVDTPQMADDSINEYVVFEDVDGILHSNIG